MPARRVARSRSVARKFCRMRAGAAGVGRGEVDPAAALRAQHHCAAGKAVGVGRANRRKIGRGRHRRGVEQQLDIGQRPGRSPARFQKRHQPARQVGGDPAAAEIRVRQLPRNAVGAHRGVQRARLLAGDRPPAPRCGPAGCSRRRATGVTATPCAAESPGSPTPDSINSCGELMTPPREDHLAFGTSDVAFAGVRYSTPRRGRPRTGCASPAPRPRPRDWAAPAPAADRRPRRCSAGRCGSCFGSGRNLPAAHRCSRRSADIRRRRRRRIGVDQGVVITRRLHGQRALAAAIRVGAALPAFLAAEIRQHMGVGPGGSPPAAQRS